VRLGLSALMMFVILPVFAANQSLPKSRVKPDEDVKVREYMIEISRQLGVTCNYCHDVKNFRSNSMRTWKLSQEHMRIVELLNTKGFSKLSKVKADCYMCHRGKAIPEYHEPSILEKNH